MGGGCVGASERGGEGTIVPIGYHPQRIDTRESG